MINIVVIRILFFIALTFSSITFANTTQEIPSIPKQNRNKILDEAKTLNAPPLQTSYSNTSKKYISKYNQKFKVINYAPKNNQNSIINPISNTNMPNPLSNQSSFDAYRSYSINSINSNQPQRPESVEKSPTKSIDSNHTKSLTKGNYFGIDFINTNLSFREVWYHDGGVEKQPFSSESKNGFGIKYMYAMNFNKFFIAPEIFYEKTNIRKNSDLNDGGGQYGQDYKKLEFYGYRWLDIQSRIGTKLNVGYDVNPYFTPYAFVGYSQIKYKNLWSSYPYYEEKLLTYTQKYFIDNYGLDPFVIKNERVWSPFYGFGAKIKISSRFFLNTEYMALNFKMKTGHRRIEDDYLYPSQYVPEINSNKLNINTRLKIIKIGLAYNF